MSAGKHRMDPSDQPAAAEQTAERTAESPYGEMSRLETTAGSATAVISAPPSQRHHRMLSEGGHDPGWPRGRIGRSTWTVKPRSSQQGPHPNKYNTPDPDLTEVWLFGGNSLNIVNRVDPAGPDGHHIHRHHNTGGFEWERWPVDALWRYSYSNPHELGEWSLGECSAACCTHRMPTLW
jgi:hypothetical protein